MHEALRRGLLCPDDLLTSLRHVSRARPARSVLALLEELEVGGAWSPPEAALLPLVRSSRLLPEPRLNCAVAAVDDPRLLLRLDGLFWSLAFGWQVDSRRWHEEPEQWMRTLDVGLTGEHRGLRVFHLAPEQVGRRRREVLELFEATALERLHLGPPAGLRLLPDLLPPVRRQW